MFGHVRFQDGNMYTEQSKKLTLNGISNTHTPYEGIWQQSGAFYRAIFHTACTAPAHTYLLERSFMEQEMTERPDMRELPTKMLSVLIFMVLFFQRIHSLQIF